MKSEIHLKTVYEYIFDTDIYLHDKENVNSICLKPHTPSEKGDKMAKDRFFSLGAGDTSVADSKK